MKFLKPLVLLVFAFVSLQLFAQSSKWLSYQFSKKVSLQTATIKINNKTTSYNDLLKIADSSLLKIEVYSRKAAQDIVDKDEAKNGLVLVTLHKKHFPASVAKKDTAAYIINDNGDTIHCKTAVPATINGDTSSVEWLHFLERSLNSQTPADNGSPAGVYNVDVIFVVNKDGSISDINIPEDPGYGTGAEVKRLLSKAIGWDPAMCNDEPVIYRQKERITFVVTEQ